MLKELRFGSGLDAVQPDPAGEAGYLRLPLRCSRGLLGFPEPGRALRLGIAPGYPSSLAKLAPVRSLLVNGAERWPGGEELAERLVTLPTHSRLSDYARRCLLQAVNEYPRRIRVSHNSRGGVACP
jgi:hypothetical protein